MRDILFISHATPQDNEFTAWLNSRLQRLGYKTWCDLKGLTGGERDYWFSIENEIRCNAIKYLLVLSENTLNKDGVLDEYEFARSIAKEHSIVDFIIPLRIQNIPYNSRIGLNRYNQIDFADSWANGLRQLVEKLENDSVPRYELLEYKEIVQNYNDLLRIPVDSVIKKKELHYSTFWEISNPPERMFVFTFHNEKQAKHIEAKNNLIPVVRHCNNIVSFEFNLDFMLPNSTEEISPISVTDIATNEIIQGLYQVKSYPTQSDCEYLIKRLMNRSLHLFLRNRGLFWQELSNKSNCYFFPIDLIKKNKSTIYYHNRKKTKNLLGKFSLSYWHFAISYKAQLFPFLCYSLKTHILFSNDGRNIWKNKDKLHRARRKKGMQMYNEEWRDQLFAFLHGLRNDENKIIIPFSSTDCTEMSSLTKVYFSTSGYREPDSKLRLDLINTYFDEEEFYIGEENE